MRARLTLWYVCVLAIVLSVYAAFTVLFLHVSLREGLDQGLDAELDRVEDALVAGPDGSIRLGGHDEGGSLVEVWSPEGALLLRRPEQAGQALGAPRVDAGGITYESLRTPSGVALRALSRIRRVGQRDVLVRVAMSEEPLLHELRELEAGLLVGLPLAIAIAGLGGHWLAKRTLAPIDTMARHAERLTADTLGERLPVDNPRDELGQLARVFNVALARIEESFARLRRFSADVSHELRTPLTAIRSVGEVGLGGRRTESEYRETIGSILEEADRLTVMVDTLLALSRADAGEVRLHFEPVDLAALAREVAAHLAVLAEEKEQELEVAAAEGVVVPADRLVVRQALVNVVDNAIKYSPPGSTIRVAVSGDAAAGRIEVADQGPGIGPEHRERIFERFYRIDTGRSRGQGGAGLGLSLAEWAMAAHAGRIEVESADGRGSTFRLSLPRGVAAAGQPAR